MHFLCKFCFIKLRLRAQASSPSFNIFRFEVGVCSAHNSNYERHADAPETHLIKKFLVTPLANYPACTACTGRLVFVLPFGAPGHYPAGVALHFNTRWCFNATRRLGGSRRDQKNLRAVVSLVTGHGVFQRLFLALVYYV